MDKRFLEELYNLIIEITNQGEKINSFHLNAIKYLFCKYYDVTNYVYKVSIGTIDNNATLGRIDREEKSIILDANKIDEDYKSDDLFEYNLNIVKVFLHELEHANQSRMNDQKDYANYKNDINDFLNYCTVLMLNVRKIPLIINKGDGLQNKMVQMFMAYFDIESLSKEEADDLVEDLYSSLYEYDLLERMADIKAYKAILDMLPTDSKYYGKFFTKYLNSLTRGYVYDEEKNDYNAPLAIFLYNYGLLEIYIGLRLNYEKFDNKSEFESLLLGLPIDVERMKEFQYCYQLRTEMDNTKELTKFLNKKIENNNSRGIMK